MSVVAGESAAGVYPGLEVCWNNEFLFLCQRSGKLKGVEKVKFRS